MNAYKLLSHIAMSAALIMGVCCTTYAASETVNVHSLSALANRVDTAQSTATTDPETTSSSNAQRTQEHERNTSSSADVSEVRVPKAAVITALMASSVVPKPLAQNHESIHSSAADGKTEASTPDTPKPHAPKPDAAESHSSSQEKTPSHPDLTPTGYIEALIAPLSVAKDLGKNCQQVLSSNTGNQDICDQFDRAVDNLAQDQANIEKTTPRPKDTKSVAPELMNHFNQLSQQLNQEVQYLRAYRATQK